jgi:hypothetical protein
MTAKAIEAGTAETVKHGSVHESAVRSIRPNLGCIDAAAEARIGQIEAERVGA